MEALRSLWDTLLSFVDFLATYALIKCMLTLLAGTVFLCLIFFVQRFFGRKNANRSYYLYLLVLPMAFMGMSKLFYLPVTFKVTNFIYGIVKPIYGKIYLVIALLFLYCFLHKNRCLRASLKNLATLQDQELRRRAIVQVTQEDLSEFPRKYLNRVQIYVIDEEISPFSGGILRPFVVLPEKMIYDRREEWQFQILCHELIHIKSGHILWMTLFRLLRIYWWINPLIYFAEKEMLEQMEMTCDEKCIACTNMKAIDYGSLLLDMVTMFRSTRYEGVASLFSRNNFQILKKRVVYLDSCKNTQSFHKRLRKQEMTFFLVIAVLCAVITATSYPRYTEMKEIYLYDENIKLVSNNTEEVGRCVKVVNGKLEIEEKGFCQLLEKYHLDQDEYVYVSYDGIMKVPGVGGGGNAGMVSTCDYQDIFYLSKDCFENDLMIFWLKYLI